MKYPNETFRFRQMLHRHDNSKRVIALLGVMLAMSSGMQHAHLLCGLSGCAVAAVAEHTYTLASAENHSCSHSCDCHASKTTGGDQGDHSPCPCPPECWCQQAPQPLELPRSVPEPTELLLQGFICCTSTSIAVANCDLIASQISFGATDATTESSVERCVQLCRFLI